MSQILRSSDPPQRCIFCNVYSGVTRPFPRDEQFGLTRQIRRASVSIPSNIGEGKRRKRQKAYLYHLDIGLGSQGEMDVQLEIAKRLGFLPALEYSKLQRAVEEVGRMLNGLITSMQPPEGDDS